jgi:hypothetical protein
MEGLQVPDGMACFQGEQDRDERKRAPQIEGHLRAQQQNPGLAAREGGPDFGADGVGRRRYPITGICARDHLWANQKTSEFF